MMVKFKFYLPRGRNVTFTSQKMVLKFGEDQIKLFQARQGYMGVAAIVSVTLVDKSFVS